MNRKMTEALSRVLSIAKCAAFDTDGFPTTAEDDGAIEVVEKMVTVHRGLAQVMDWARAWVQNETTIEDRGDRCTDDERAGLEVLRGWGVID